MLGCLINESQGSLRISWEAGAPERVTSEPQELTATAAVVNMVFSNQLVHVDIVVGHRNLIEQLALERQSHEWCIFSSVLQQFVVVSFAMSHATASTIEADARNHDQIQ